ncbi:UNVERIFIED_CONTAM: T9SS type A sorting domain-containing protein, partial [Salmonella enterica subsp. enterica serovar Weltevreden]
YEGESLALRLSDSMGRSVLVQTLNPTESHSITPLILPAGLATGTYILTLAGSNHSIQKRITVSN